MRSSKKNSYVKLGAFSVSGVSWLLIGWVIFLLLAPLVGATLALWQGAIQPDISNLGDLYASERLQNVIIRTILVALSTSSLCLVLAGILEWLLHKFSPSWQNIWLLFYFAGFVLSPYVYTQGWINLMGSNGYVWSWLGLTNPLINLYSDQGVLFLLVLANLPLSLMVLHFSASFFPAPYAEHVRLLQLNWWQRFHLLWLRKWGSGGAIAFCLVLGRAIWAYDIPSMLRQNYFGLEVYAAFGSFYDLNLALSLALPVLFLGLPLAGVLLFLARQNRQLRSVKRHHSSPTPGWKWATLFLCLYPLFTWVLPSISLLLKSGDVNLIGASLFEFSSEIQTTLGAGLLAACIGLVGALYLSFFLKYHQYHLAHSTLLIGSVILIFTPTVVSGILLRYILTLPIFSWDNFPVLQMVLIWLILFTPYFFLVSCLLLTSWHRSWTESCRLMSLPSLHAYLCIVLSQYRFPLVLLFSIFFCLCVQEVPASLLNQAPGGATLALTIETMLHFDQPEAVSRLCLIQLLLCFLVLALVYFLSHYLRRHANQLLPTP